jgi:hypothetical protein
MLYQRYINIPAFHCVKYFKGILIKDIVQNFNKIGVPVKTNKQVPGIMFFLLVAIVKPLIVQGIVKNHTYIHLAYAMPESRPAEPDVNIHDFSIPEQRAAGNEKWFLALRHERS